MTLQLVKPDDDLHVNVVLYGAPKTGKTTGAASAPGSILLLNADRPNATRFAHRRYGDRIEEARVTGLDTLVEAMQAVRDGAYDTVIVDTVGEVYRIVLEDLSDRALSPKIQNYGDTGTHVERFCRALVEMPVNAIFVLHEFSEKNEETGEIEHRPFTGTKNPVLAEKLMAMVDVIGYTGVVREKDDVTYVAQLINGRGRKGGDRFGVLGTDRELDLSEWMDAIQGAVAPVKEGAA